MDADFGLWLSNTLRIVGLFAAFAGAALSLTSGIAQNYFQKIVTARKDAALVEYQTEATKQIAAANDRAAAANKQAEQAKLAQEELKATLAWRRVSKAQHEKIVNRLLGRKFVVKIVYPPTDPEAATFANDVGKTLRDAGLLPEAQPTIDDSPSFGIGISRTIDDALPDSDWVALAEAFKSADITLGLGDQAKVITIFIGSKKQPF